MTRLTLDTTRIVGFTLNSDDNHLTLELRVPRNATGALADKVIVVDAGHGGAATGAPGVGFGGTVYEKDITLAIALKLRTALESCGAKVVMTRDHDVDVPLYDRPKLANEIHADLFISIHNDSNRTPNSASGSTTYYHASEPSSRALAMCVQDAVRAVTGLPSRGALSDEVLYTNGLAVLRASTMPAVLCEVAYINHAGDRKRLLDADFQLHVAEAICDGLRCYIEGNPSTAPRPPVFIDDPEKKDKIDEEPPSGGHEKDG
jgi:N-acetylmuramoyl-L-alanine amidase